MNVSAFKRRVKKRLKFPVDLKKLMIWVNRTGRWEPIDASVQFRKSKASICREVVMKVFGFSGAQYDAIRDALDDVDSGGMMGIYKHENNPGQYAIVLRLPVGTQCTKLKMGGAVGTGLLLGAAGMWANGLKAVPAQQKVNVEEIWCQNYFRYIMQSNKLRALQETIKGALGIQYEGPDTLFPEYGDDSKQPFYEWHLMNAITPLDERKAKGKEMSNKMQEPTGARHIHIVFSRPDLQLQGQDMIYVSRLLNDQPDQCVDVRKQLVETAFQVISSRYNMNKNFRYKWMWPKQT